MLFETQRFIIRVESLILEAKGLLPEAYDRMKMARDQEPESASFAHRMGQIAEQRGDKITALKHYDEAIQLDNNLLEALLSKTRRKSFYRRRFMVWQRKSLFYSCRVPLSSSASE